MSIQRVYKKGRLVADDSLYIGVKLPEVPQPRSTMNASYAVEDFVVHENEANKIRVIEIVPHQIVTKLRLETPKSHRDMIVPDLERDILKLVVVERHHATGNVGVGFDKGFGIKHGALGSTVAHDAHNIVVVGTNDLEIISAVIALEEMRRGQVVVVDGKVEASLPLPIAGLVSDQPLEAV